MAKVNGSFIIPLICIFSLFLVLNKALYYFFLLPSFHIIPITVRFFLTYDESRLKNIILSMWLYKIQYNV